MSLDKILPFQGLFKVFFGFILILLVVIAVFFFYGQFTMAIILTGLVGIIMFFMQQSGMKVPPWQMMIFLPSAFAIGYFGQKLSTMKLATTGEALGNSDFLVSILSIAGFMILFIVISTKSKKITKTLKKL